MYRELTVLAFLLVSSLRAYPNGACENAVVRLRVPSELSFLSLSQLKYSSGESSEASFLMENRGSKEIKFLTLVLEYGTKSDDHLSIVYETATNPEQPSEFLIPAQYVRPLARGILPGQQVLISGSSPYTLRECPTLTRVTMLDVLFADRSRIRWENHNWWTMPLLSNFPDCLTILDSKIWSGDEYYFLTRVNRNGQVEESVPIAPTSTVPSETVAGVLKRLTFAPALLNGEPSGASVILRVRFRRLGKEKGQKIETMPTIRGPWALVQLSNLDPERPDWVLDFGGEWSYKSDRVAKDVCQK